MSIIIQKHFVCVYIKMKERKKERKKERRKEKKKICKINTLDG
jgi:hypothetical protein